LRLREIRSRSRRRWQPSLRRRPQRTSPCNPRPGFPTAKWTSAEKASGPPFGFSIGADKKYVEQSIDVPFTPAGLELYKERQANHSKDDPEGYCPPAGVPRYTGAPCPFQLIQLPDRVVILYEGASHMYRVILLTTKHSADPNPSWLGESIGWYEGNDTLVVDTIGFNGRTWLDYVGHPASNQLHVVERFSRPNYSSLHYEATIEDPKNYTKPWTTRFNVKWRSGWELQEYVCL
jgi:hypothetical protein